MATFNNGDNHNFVVFLPNHREKRMVLERLSPPATAGSRLRILEIQKKILSLHQSNH